MSDRSDERRRYLSGWATLGWVLVAAAGFHLAYWRPGGGFAVALFVFGAAVLTRVRQVRFALYCGLLLGMLIYAPHLHFFWRIFGAFSLALWFALSVWLAVFVLLGRLSYGVMPRWVATLALPVLWLGTEYIRCELNYLRFAWLTPGLAFSHQLGWLPLKYVGAYGLSFGLMLVASVVLLPRQAAWGVGAAGLAVLGVLVNVPVEHGPRSRDVGPLFAGIQLEVPTEHEVVAALDEALVAEPDADVFVLSEYAFSGPVPQRVREWCREHARYLIAGGEHEMPRPSRDYYNTAFVIGPTGEVEVEQAKCVPIQFFRDGLPAPRQGVWQSPWGPIGLCVCYDLSYARVTDELIRLGARAVVCPAMDVEQWGRYEHELHTRIAPARAAEYGVPIFRLCSSGISQLVDADGMVVATAPFPGQGSRLVGRLPIASASALPWDRWLVPVAVAVTLGWPVVLIVIVVVRRRMNAECRSEEARRGAYEY
ncbi:MAG: carbon-nitrogen hydrolase family protein [Phycisphaerae bacterium]|nr:carbon-nitrogen hydrolase family protein [Phycisphaerae bacterium]